MSFIWIRARIETLWAAVRALKELSVHRHDEARLERAIDGRRAEQLSAEGDHLDAQAEELRTQLHDAEEEERDGSSTRT